MPNGLQRTAAPLGSRTVQMICQRLLQPTGRFRRRSLVVRRQGVRSPLNTMPKSYDIDEILALPSTTELVTRLSEELTKSAPHLNDSEKAILDALEWDGYISGDGIMEWFDTHSAPPIAWFRHALGLLGASKHLACIDRALTVFPNSTPPEDYEKYRDTVFGLSKDQRQMIEDCTKEYYETNGQEDIHELIRHFVISNIGEFK